MQAIAFPQSTPYVSFSRPLQEAAEPSPPAPRDRLDWAPAPARRLRLSGLIAPGDRLHAAQPSPSQLISPIQVPIPGGLFVPQYAPTVVGTENVYDPGGDCNGNFMASRFQVNNNCYNYACDIATNSFAQPGRKHGTLLDTPLTGEAVANAAVEDGLMLVSHQPMSREQLLVKQQELPPGHFVALLISDPDEQAGWSGDYHWVRQDRDGSWSQKDGTDSVTNFDFAGRPIADPAAANWTVNQGPIDDEQSSDALVSYHFHSIMYVPDGKVDII